MDSGELDQHEDLGLGTIQAQGAPPDPEPARKRREIQHQRGIGEDQIGEIDDHVTLGLDRAGKAGTPGSLSRSVLVASTVKHGLPVIEVDDPGNL